MFSRLLGLDDPLPPVASEFYCALLNRLHARAGPIVGEAAEGVSQVKCKVCVCGGGGPISGLAPLYSG